jgi:dipeptidyl aminopeptidase/acylaminoacyl peptidase
MIIHGANDSLVPVEGARRMADALEAVSNQPVVYAALPYAQHAFDIYASRRTRHTVRAVERFLAYVGAAHIQDDHGSVIAPLSAPATSRAYLASTPDL